jgi:hypothetical protein
LPKTVCKTCIDAYHSLVISEAFGGVSFYILINANNKSKTKFKNIDNLITVKSMGDISGCLNPNLITVLTKSEEGHYEIIEEKSVESLISSIGVPRSVEDSEKRLTSIEKIKTEKYNVPLGTVMINHADAIQGGLRLFTIKVIPPDNRGIPMFYLLDSEGKSTAILCDTLPGNISRKGFSGVSGNSMSSDIFYSDGAVQLDHYSSNLVSFRELNYYDYFPAYYFHEVFNATDGHFRPLTSYQFPKSARVTHVDQLSNELTFFGPSESNQSTCIYPIEKSNKAVYSYSKCDQILLVTNSDHDGFLVYNTSKDHVFPYLIYSITPVFGELILNNPEYLGADISLMNLSVKYDNVLLAIKVELGESSSIFLSKINLQSNEFMISSLLLSEKTKVIAGGFIDDKFNLISLSEDDKVLIAEYFNF